MLVIHEIRLIEVVPAPVHPRTRHRADSTQRGRSARPALAILWKRSAPSSWMVVPLRKSFSPVLAS